MDQLDMFIKLGNLVVKVIALEIGGTWATYKIKEYRELKNWVQLDLDAHIYKLTHPEHIPAKIWDKQGKPIDLSPRTHTHAVEVLLKFTNKGKTRARIFNIQVGINAMRPHDQAEFDSDDGHLHLTRI